MSNPTPNTIRDIQNNINSCVVDNGDNILFDQWWKEYPRKDGSKKNALQSFIKLKSEIIEHRNFVGGRYSALSEVGMLPAELLGLKSEKFKKFDNLIKNKNFTSTL